jgi:hypothetical protein
MSNAANQPSPYAVNNGGTANAGNGVFNSAGSTRGNSSYPRTNGLGTPWTPGATSPESIAWSMVLSIACCEGAGVDASGTIIGGVDRQWILGTYTDCLRTVNGCGGSSNGQVSNFRQAS